LPPNARARTVPARVQDVSKARTALVLAAVLFSSGGVIIKGTALDAWQVACFRSLVAACAFPLLVPSARRLPTRAEWLVGVAYAATMILFVLANKLTTAASSIYLQSTAPVYILILSPWLLRERATRKDVPFLLAMAVAIGLLVVGTPETQSTAPDPALGNALALASGLCWALTMMGLRRLQRAQSGEGRDHAGGGGTGAVVAGNVIAVLFTASFAMPIGASGPRDWAAIAFLGVVQIALAYRFLTFGLTRVAALEASLILLVEPVFSPLWSWLAYGERPGLLALAGGAIVAVATTVKAAVDARARRSA
jgi:drug/metabolite transporter (DMT)-like permease